MYRIYSLIFHCVKSCPSRVVGFISLYRSLFNEIYPGSIINNLIVSNVQQLPQGDCCRVVFSGKWWGKYFFYVVLLILTQYILDFISYYYLYNGLLQGDTQGWHLLNSC